MKTLLMAGALIAAASSTLSRADLDEDRRITREVTQRIASDPGLSSQSGRIAVDTTNGVVTLTGVVRTPPQANRAEMDARGVYGVEDVENLMDVEIIDN